MDIEHAKKLKKEAAVMFDETDWDVVVDVDESNVALLERKQYDGYDLSHYRIRVDKINLSIDELVKIVFETDKDSATVDDPSIIEFEVIEGSDTYKLRRQVNKLKWPAWPRETLFAQYKIVEDNVIWLVGFSVDDARRQVNRKTCVRTTVALSVYRYTALDDDSTRVERVTNINPNGLIPTFIINAAASRAINAFNRWYSLGVNSDVNSDVEQKS